MVMIYFVVAYCNFYGIKNMYHFFVQMAKGRYRTDTRINAKRFYFGLFPLARWD